MGVEYTCNLFKEDGVCFVRCLRVVCMSELVDETDEIDDLSFSFF